MLSIKIDVTRGIALLEPQGALTQEDFLNAAKTIDPYINSVNGVNHAKTLKGIVIHAESFPGWDSFGALLSHLKFVHEHEKKVARVALATDMKLANVAEKLVNHFIHAELKIFPYSAFAQAQDWASSLS